MATAITELHGNSATRTAHQPRCSLTPCAIALSNRTKPAQQPSNPRNSARTTGRAIAPFNAQLRNTPEQNSRCSASNRATARSNRISPVLLPEQPRTCATPTGLPSRSCALPKRSCSPHSTYSAQLHYQARCSALTLLECWNSLLDHHTLTAALEKCQSSKLQPWA